MSDSVELKRRIRLAIRESRRQRAMQRAQSDSPAHTERLQQLVRDTGAARITSFIGVGGEPDTAAFHAWARAEGIEVLLPCVLESGEMEWARLTAEPLVTGAFGIPEPAGPRFPPDAPARADLMLVPAAAVDSSGGRLGWGRGFFDRSLQMIVQSAAPPQVVAVVHEDEVFDAATDPLPTEPHDVPVDGAVTEVRVHWFTGRNQEG